MTFPKSLMVTTKEITKQNQKQQQCFLALKKPSKGHYQGGYLYTFDAELKIKKKIRGCPNITE